MSRNNRTIFFLLFTLSGFSGLIYESIWTHYLKLFLGHAAYAQSLVLAIFMGGMAAGSWICSRWSPRWKNLLFGYALAEGTIGLCALVFHNLFVSATDLSYSSIIPNLDGPIAVNAWKWGLSALLIFPQSVLLGMTFPLMSAGVLRRFPEKPGRSVALLYFVNSIGASVGVLVNGFFLIRLVGLPWTMRIAGTINIVLALTVWLLIRGEKTPVMEENMADETPASAPSAGRLRLFLAVSLVTGTASFIYEIGWIRMLGLVLGSSTHAFELMLSAFILGLALGGLWIQRRIDRLSSPARFLGWIQVVMGLLALSTLPVYGATFSVMQWLVQTLEKTDAGYALFNLSSSAIAMAVMLPATFCAGTTLPLITFLLMREGEGERSIGAVYAANTLGAIAGVFFAIHLGMPLLGLKGLISSGAGLDILAGLVLLWTAGKFHSRRIPLITTAVCICAVAATSAFVELDLFKMGSGVYRYGILLPRQSFRHLYHKDGKTATVDVFQDGLGSIRINTNGKTDATIMMDPQRSAGMDESTMTLLAAIPMALHPQATSAVSIGLGSGLTTQVLLSNPRMRQVDTVEIEKGMVEGAQNFRPNVDRVYTDPRSRIHVDDAKTFFSSHKDKYDLIISEPSNPWVSGVSGLFSQEFYRLIKRSMNDDALFVQWVQLYEINTDLVVSILKAVSANFGDFVVYAPDESDIVIAAVKKGQVPELNWGVLQTPSLAALLKRVQVEGIQDLALRKVGDKRILEKFLVSFPIRANSDYFPVLDQNAARTRFLNENAQDLIYFTQLPLPTLDLLTRHTPPWSATQVTPTAAFPKSQAAFAAAALRDYFIYGKAIPSFLDIAGNDREQAVRLKKLFSERNALPSENDRLESMLITADNILPYLTPSELGRIWQTLESGPGASSLSPLDRQCIALFKAIGRRDAGGMIDAARALLAGNQLGGPTVKYVVASAMTGYLMQGNTGEAYRLWEAYGPSISSQGRQELLFRLLAAESGH